MTVMEIRNSLPIMVIWMANEAVMEGVQSYHKNQQQHDCDSDFMRGFRRGESERGVKVAAEVLWKLFASCSADCQRAIEKVAEKRDGFCGNPDAYFDDFVEALGMKLGYPVRIRTVE